MQDAEPLNRFQERAPRAASALLAGDGPLHISLSAVLSASDFVLDALARDDALAAQLLERQRERLAGAPLALPPTLARLEQGALPPDESEFMTDLRRWRRAEFTRIAWRDLAGWASLNETLSDLSRAADLALRLSQEFATRALIARDGRPLHAGQLQELVIVAMGKLGGHELNFSSDIDLVLLYPQGGETETTGLSNQEFFTRLSQRLVRLLAHPTAEGLAFRVDLRLRPFGDSGPIVSSAAALDDYLQIHGRDWERYAWVKARAVTGENAWTQLFRTTVQPFVYRRYLDFGVFESLQEMKALIEREVQRRELADNIKLGDGGIREIEFIVQSFQLIRGGQDRRLQHSSLRHALPLLAGAKLLPAAAVEELDAAYVFLRRLENRLQMYADQQQHELPREAVARERLTVSMGERSWSALAEQLAGHRARVAEHFRAVVFGRRAAGTRAVPVALPLGEDAALHERLTAMGYAQAADAARALQDLQHAASIRRLDEIGGRRLRALLPLLATEAAATPRPLATLRRLLTVLEAIGGRSTYFSLLSHDERARQRLVQLCAHGDFLSAQIAAHPLLLDELIDQTLLEQRLDRATLAADLQQRMEGVDPEDEEQLLERLRQFQRAALFRLAVADLLAHLPVMQVSDRLTDVAELIVERALALAWQYLTRQLGTPMCGEGTQRRVASIAVIGYGKLGGLELGYSSDLDLVFIHDSRGEAQHTDGARPIDNQVFFVRFAQRLVHLLTVHSAAGRLYEVDMRLRPSGKSGLLITSIEAFVEYQRHEAWTFEHQALLHARAVAGDAQLRARFEVVRGELLAQAVRRERLREEVRDMRLRMRRELSHAKPGWVDLKQDLGGIADIEFLAQYWALRWARDYPPVAWYSDTIRQLESVGSADLIPQTTIDMLTDAYRRYRSTLHHRALDGLGALLPADELTTERAAVAATWNQYMEQ